MTGADRCEYHERDVPCRVAAVHEVQFDGRKHLLCARHARPEYHPRDLHRKFPGVIRRAVRSLS